mmetsp:Transcript_16556/g.24913  ORF Transcript_16556/g.24913 Transcript_16556/m.24913 type:complete len:99 (+) Transcript_16556:104-400(+)
MAASIMLYAKRSTPKRRQRTLTATRLGNELKRSRNLKGGDNKKLIWKIGDFSSSCQSFVQVCSCSYRNFASFIREVAHNSHPPMCDHNVEACNLVRIC